MSDFVGKSKEPRSTPHEFPNTMTKGERTDILKVVRAQERLAKTEVKEQATALKADFEQQLDTSYGFNSDDKEPPQRNQHHASVGL